MKVTGIDKSWVATPFWRHKMVIEKWAQIDQLRGAGVQCVEVELEDLEVAPAEQDHGMPEEALLAPPDIRREEPVQEPDPSGIEVPFEEELSAAKAAYTSAKGIIQHAMNDVRMGQDINSDAVFAVVEQMADSVLRNPHALVSLTRLKSFDEYTFYHSVNTSILALTLGRSFRMEPPTLRWLGIGALLHDIGKTKIPVEILNKPGKLSDVEFEVMKQHALRGVEILQDTTGLHEEVVRPALEHHERVDGTGYPFRRTKDALSQFGLIASVVDIYDAVTSDRVYHKAMSAYGALQLLYSLGKKRTLDISLVERFIQCVGVYPVGTCVELNTGEIAIVKEQHPENPLAPILLIIQERIDQSVTRPRVLDLLLDSSTPIKTIVSVQNADALGIDPNALLDVQPV